MNRYRLKTHPLILSTLILTATGFLTRILGFFFRIYLSRTIGAEGLGLYQMIFPIYGICFSLCGGSIQTAISKMTAADQTKGKQALITGLIVSCSSALFLSILISSRADFLAVHILMEPKCAPLLPVLALAIPCTALHACICGYYYGRERISVPAFSQFLEQCIRIFSVYLISQILLSEGKEITTSIAVWGLVIGEIGSALFVLLSLFIFQQKMKSTAPVVYPIIYPAILPAFFSLVLPLMANRLIMNLMQSAEAILIPNQLEAYGFSGSQALSLYGILTGMALPFIMFPSAIVNSFSVVLLPTIAKEQASGNHSGIEKHITQAYQYSLYMGILCVGIFVRFGNELGVIVFQNSDAGSFISILAWLCPFLYLATSIGSILNGLGKTTTTFLHHVVALSIRLFFVLIGIPRLGILAYLWGILVSEILAFFLHAMELYRQTKVTLNVWEILIKPILCLLFSLGIFSLFPDAGSLTGLLPLPPFLIVMGQIGLVCAGYGLTLMLAAG